MVGSQDFRLSEQGNPAEPESGHSTEAPLQHNTVVGNFGDLGHFR